MTGRLASLAFCLALAACAAPPPVLVPTETDVAVPVPCHAPAVAPPDFALTAHPLPPTLFARTQAALIELDQRRGYEMRLNAALSACE